MVGRCSPFWMEAHPPSHSEELVLTPFGGNLLAQERLPGAPCSWCATRCGVVDGRKRLHREITERLRADWSDVLETSIPASAEIERMGLVREAVVTHSPHGKAATAYRELWEEVKLRLAQRQYASEHP